MTEKSTRLEKMSNFTKPVPMKLFAAWEVDRTPPNCIPRLCSLTITRLSLLSPLPVDLSSVSLAVKMQSSKRTLRSHEIPVPQSVLTANASGAVLNSPPLLETELDLNFSLQYPHFIKRDGNRLLILLQRRKKYKTRTILGYKTLAEGMIRMDAVLQKSMDMTVELSATGKGSRPGVTLATLRAERVSSIPVDHDNKNNNSVLLTDRVNEYSDEDEEGEFSSGEENDDPGDGVLSGYDAKRGYAKRGSNYRKLERSENDAETEDAPIGQNPGDSDSEFENLGKDKGNRAKMSRKLFLNEKLQKYARMDFFRPSAGKASHYEQTGSFPDTTEKILMQRNFKQKIVALLKRFKVPEELDGGVSRHSGRGERVLDALYQELESLSCGEGDESGPDMDTVSVGSTPKPSLRPFFTNSRTMLHENLMGDFNSDMKMRLEKRDSFNAPSLPLDKKNSIPGAAERSGDWRNDSSGNEGGAGNTDPEAPNSDPQNTGSPPRSGDKESATDRRSRLFRAASGQPSSSKKKHSLSLGSEQSQPKSALDACLSPTNVEPRKSLLDQVARTFATDEAILPDVVSLVGPPELHHVALSSRLAPLLAASFRPTFAPHNTAEVRAVMQALMNKIQKYCNSTAKPPTTIKVLLLGGDWLQGAVLRHYVELLGVRPPDWVNHIRFYIVPIGSSAISRYLSAVDATYGAMFGSDGWQQLCERAIGPDPAQSKIDVIEVTNRVQRYLHSAGPCTQIPIAEAMVNYKEEDSCQIFVPFVSDVKLGCPEGPQVSLDMDESLGLSGQQISSALSSSPPQSGRMSPPVPTTPATPSQQQEKAEKLEKLEKMQQMQAQQPESYELQIDYWPVAARYTDNKEKKEDKKGTDQGKNSIKSTFRNLQVWRLPPNPQAGELLYGLTLSYSTKEKKQKIMRLGKKKEKDRDMEKEQSVDGIARLICSPKPSHPVPLRVYIDGTEWTGVKFFQLSSLWQTHVKNFPVGLIGAPLAPAET
ncbi:phosphofurin acidic cluster sorting protein 2-like isoform X1 [Phlebotomus argentipes]|uniref:phosphofurin acidic cluster sorting protein 2-like isoform X1 n=1 Tax=Phlebotomus argentipes TaxID=94469 RepID=UPI00289323A1|nr:phosphofurin acidic cluster sorting protein 2-like isoform X1 [Phlebotomus argentipes]